MCSLRRGVILLPSLRRTTFVHEFRGHRPAGNLPDRRTVPVKTRDADERAFSIGLALDNVSGVDSEWASGGNSTA